MFDDLIPQNKGQGTTTPVGPVPNPALKKTTTTGGMFDDLVPDTKGSAVPLYVKATNPEFKNDVPFEYKKGDGFTNVLRTVGNAPKSLYNIGKGIANVVMNPIDTVKNIGNLIGGTVATGAEKVIENTDAGQKFLEFANQSRRERGLPELVRREDGTLDAPDTDQMKMAKGVGSYLGDRYGGVENIKRTVVEDPAGIALDVSALFTGGSTLAPKVAKVAEVAGMAKTANTITKAGNVMSKVAEVTDPIRQTVKVAKPVVSRKLNDLNDLGKMSGTELKSKALKEGLYGMNETIGTLKRKFEDTSYTYTKPDGTVIDVNPIDTMVEYDLIPQPARGGSLDVSKIKEAVPRLNKELSDKIDTVLKTDGKTISINDYANELENAIDKMGKSKLEKTRLAQQIDSELEALNKAYPDGQIPLDEINKIRKEANEKFKKDRLDFDRVTGNATREIVYNTTDDMVVKDLLNEQRKLINAEEYASKLGIHKVKGGRLGNYVWGGLGAMIGSATKLPMGFGEGIGYFGGRAMSEFAQRRQLKSIPADVKSGLERVVGKPLKVDVKGGLEKMLGQKSPNTKPAKIIPTAKPNSSIDNIITPKNNINKIDNKFGTQLTYKNLQENDYSKKYYGESFDEPVEYFRAGSVNKNGDIWLTPNEAGAKQYSQSSSGEAKVGSYYVISKNPMIVDAVGGAMKDGNIDISKILTKEEIASGYTNNPTIKQKLIEYAKNNGYDSIQFSDSFPDGEAGMQSLVVWDKNQIKTKKQFEKIINN